jgi:outer membrane protein assembly factor BamD
VKRAWAVALLLAAGGCGGNREADIATLASNSDELIWQEGQKALEKKYWENARQHFKRIVDGFPQSEYGPAARLALGDAYFGEGGVANYILAVAAYRDFLTLFPSHPRADYAQFQVAESFYKQLNSADRDQEPTRKALDEFQRVLELHPATSYIELTRQRVAECRKRLARHEFLVGWFYQRTRQWCKAAITRYETVLDSFPDYEQTDEVLLRLGECLSRSGRGAEALPRLARLISDYPASPHAEAARLLMTEIQNQPPPSPAPPSSPAPAPSPAASPSPAPSQPSSET